MKKFFLIKDTTRRKLISWLVVVFVFSVSFLTYAAIKTYNKIDSQDISSIVDSKNTDGPPAINVDLSDSKEMLNIIVMGSDERDEDSDIKGMRSDTTILLNISADRSKVTGVSIPRDSWVNVPSCERTDGTFSRPHEGKFNYAFSAGGLNGDPASAAACAINTLQSLTDIEINGYIVVDMSGFEKIVDTLGGVEMTLDEPIDSPKADLKLPAGKQILNGKDALGYARARSGDGLDGSDLSRIDRQQELFAEIIKTAKSKATNPVTLLNLINNGADMVVVSPNLKPDKSIGLLWNLRSASVSFEKLTVVPRGDGANVVWTQEAYDLIKSFSSSSDDPVSDSGGVS